MSHHPYSFGHPTPPTTASSVSARTRRSQASSSSSDASGTFGISSVKFRVGAPPLRHLPLDSDPTDKTVRAIRTIFEDDFIRRAKEAIQAHSIWDFDDEDADFDDEPSIDFVSREVPGEPETAQPTLTIVAKWSHDSPKKWEGCVSQMKRYINGRMADAPELADIDVAVEMMAKELVMRKYISPIPNDADFSKLKADWDGIRAGVFNILESFQSTASHTTAIALFNLGYSTNVNVNPRTVYISLGYASDPTSWPPVVQKVQRFLDGYGHKLQAHIEHNTVTHFAFELVFPALDEKRVFDRVVRYNSLYNSKYKDKVHLGADISAAQYITRADGEKCSPLSGTMGCYLEIKSQKLPDWTKVALTNYHVVRPTISGFHLGAKGTKREGNLRSILETPASGSELWKADQAGFYPATTGDRALVEHPARSKHNFTIEQHRKGLEASPDSATQGQLDEWVAFFDDDKHLFANAWAGSGYGRRTRSNGRLDWALLMPLDGSNRVGENRLPTKADWADAAAPWQRPRIPPGSSYATLKAPAEKSLRSIDHADLVYKVGATTKWTVGRFNGLKVECKMAEDRHLGPGMRHSTEYTFIGQGTRHHLFADVGDSGAVVFDREGRALGLLFSGQSPQGAEPDGYAFLTPIEDIFEDIKAFSKGQITDIRIADAQ